MQRLTPILLAAVLLAAPSWLLRGDELPLALAPRDGLLLLANGNVLSGKITQAGEYYYISLPTGEIRVRNGDVERFCSNLHEAYEFRRSKVEPGQLKQQLDLCEWCIQHELFGYAARELIEAMRIDPQHPRVDFVQRRLELVRQPPPEPGSIEATAALRMANQQLDDVVRRMPPGSVDAFVHTVQPLLVNHCTNAGCHGPVSTTRFSLLRTPTAKGTTRRLTQRNLVAVLEWIDRGNPAESPLLKRAIEPHGGAATPAFTQREMAHYRQLVAWTFRLGDAAAAPPLQPSTVAHPPPNLLQAQRIEEPSLSNVVPASYEETLTEPRGLLTGDSHDGPQRGAKLPGYVPVDPFDAEVFNRRFTASAPERGR